MKPTPKMIITQNVIFNCPFALIMVLASNIVNGQPIDVTVIPMFFIALVICEILGAVIPIQKIAGFIGGKVAPGKNPMAFPQFFAVAAVLTVIFTVLMALSMTFIGMKLGGAPMNLYWSAFAHVFPALLCVAYGCVLVFLPLSMAVSGLGKLAAK